MQKTIKVKAVTITPYVKAWMAKTTAVSILHQSERACNLVNQDREVVSLVTSDIGPGPFAIVLPSSSLPIQQYSRPHIKQNVLFVGATQIEMNDANVWQPRLSWRKLRKNQTVCQSNICSLQEQIVTFRYHAVSKQTAVFLHLSQLEDALISAYCNEQPDKLRKIVRQLAGLGPGLTPSGDDFLVGMLYGIWATTSEKEAQRWGRLIVETAVPYTTTLSAAWLMAAARQEAAALWHQLSAALIGGGRELDTAVSSILQIGHSSGADALAGFVKIVCK